MGAVSLDELNADLASREVEWTFEVRWIQFNEGQLCMYLQPFLQDPEVNRYDTYVVTCSNCNWFRLGGPSLCFCQEVVCLQDEGRASLKIVVGDSVAGNPDYVGVELECDSVSFALQSQTKILPPDVQLIEDETGCCCCCLWPFPWPYKHKEQNLDEIKCQVPSEWAESVDKRVFELPWFEWFILSGDSANLVIRYSGGNQAARIELNSCQAFEFFPFTVTEGSVYTYCTMVEDMGMGHSQLSIRGVYGDPGHPPKHDESESEYDCHEPIYYDAVFCKIEYADSEVTRLTRAALKRLGREFEG